MSDLISKAEVLETYAELFDVFDDSKEICKELCKVYDNINKLPSAEPEIIRCKDCKYYDGRPCGIVDYYITESDFCSYAERRTDE